MNLKVKRNIRNLTYHLIDRGRITTSVSLAKVIKVKVEKLITKAKKDSVENRRYASKKLPVKGVKKLFENIAPANKIRQGGYTRMIRVGVRIGDSRENCILEIIDV